MPLAGFNVTDVQGLLFLQLPANDPTVTFGLVAFKSDIPPSPTTVLYAEELLKFIKSISKAPPNVPVAFAPVSPANLIPGVVIVLVPYQVPEAFVPSYMLYPLL